MLKKDINLIEFNPFLDLGKTWAILTCGGANDFNSMTISWGGFGVLWNKNVCYVFIRKSRHTLNFMENNSVFTLSFLKDVYRKELNIFGTKSGRDIDKYKETGLTSVLDIDNNCVYVKEAYKVLKIRKLFKTEMKNEDFIDKNLIDKFYKDNDYHLMFVGEVIQYIVGDEND